MVSPYTRQAREWVRAASSPWLTGVMDKYPSALDLWVGQLWGELNTVSLSPVQSRVPGASSDSMFTSSACKGCLLFLSPPHTLTVSPVLSSQINDLLLYPRLRVCFWWTPFKTWGKHCFSNVEVENKLKVKYQSIFEAMDCLSIQYSCFPCKLYFLNTQTRVHFMKFNLIN